jgi:glycerol-3-phosphate dehydrogenase subunit C
MSKHISVQPTAGLSYDPSEDLYWDEDALAGEIERSFELCHGCRMCFKYCDSFKDLFQFVDDHDGDVTKVTFEQTSHVMEACFQCKLCEVECPYTPHNDHEFQLDFPKLVHRHRAIEGRKKGHTVRDRVLGDPDMAGKMARMSLGLANAMNKVAPHRWLMEKVLGVHRDKLLPEFAGRTFEAEAKSAGATFDDPEAEAVLFQTCYVQNNEPAIGHDALAVMKENGVPTTCVKGLQCCGMPAWEYGNLEQVQKQAKANLDLLEPYVKRGAKVVALNPTCSMMLRKEYPELVAEEDRERAKALSAAVRDAGELLWDLRKEDRFAEAKSSPGQTFAYHAPCHLRAQRVGFRARDVIRKQTGSKPSLALECCGHDGTFAMKVEGFEPSQKYGRKAFAEMKDADSEVWVTDCPLAAVQFEQHAGKKPMHPMTVLARSYREDGFPDTTGDE